MQRSVQMILCSKTKIGAKYVPLKNSINLSVVLVETSCRYYIDKYKCVFFFNKVSSIPFPSRTLFANTETVAQSRKRQLELYLRRLIDTCKNHPACPLAYGGPITKSALISFSPFFKKGVFENGKYGTS